MGIRWSESAGLLGAYELGGWADDGRTIPDGALPEYLLAEEGRDGLDLTTVDLSRLAQHPDSRFAGIVTPVVELLGIGERNPSDQVDLWRIPEWLENFYAARDGGEQVLPASYAAIGRLPVAELHYEDHLVYKPPIRPAQPPLDLQRYIKIMQDEYPLSESGTNSEMPGEMRQVIGGAMLDAALILERRGMLSVYEEGPSMWVGLTRAGEREVSETQRVERRLRLSRLWLRKTK